MRYLLLLFFLIIPLQHADSAWMNNAWNYKVKVEVNPNKVGTTTAITSFPVYVDLAGMPASFWTNASSTGADIRVTESDEITETAFELVSFATTTQRGELHFMADALATTSTSTFYIYYGNATATAYTATDTYGRNNVWTQYNAVYHMNEGSGTRTNSTGGTNLTATGTVSSTTGKMGNGADANSGGTNYLYGVDGTTFDITANLMMSTWVQIQTQPALNAEKFLIGKDTGGASNRSYVMNYNDSAGTKQLRQGVSKSGNFSTNAVYSQITNSMATSTWYKLRTTFATSSSNTTKITYFVNGDNKGNGTMVVNVGTPDAIFNSNVHFYVGKYGSSTAEAIDAVFDKIRLSTNLFSQAFEWTEYNNQSSTSTFFYIGPEIARTSSSTTYVSDDAFWFE